MYIVTGAAGHELPGEMGQSGAGAPGQILDRRQAAQQLLGHDGQPKSIDAGGGWPSIANPRGCYADGSAARQHHPRRTS